MANRIPLVVDGSNYRVEELPSGDTLDLNAATVIGLNATGVSTVSTLEASVLNVDATGISTIGILTGGIAIKGSTATDNTAGANNIAIGRSASTLVGIMTGQNNIAIGWSSKYPALGGHDNVILGSEAGSNLTGTHVHSGPIGLTAEYNFLCLRAAGRDLTTGSRNVFIGLGAGAGVTTGNHNYCVGEDTMSLPASGGSGSNNIVLGDQAARNLASGDGNVVIGKEAGKSNNGVGVSFTGDQNVIVGQQAGYVIRGGGYNVFTGPQAGIAATSGNYNTGVGYRALYALTSGDTNTAIGSSAGLNITTGVNNTCIGLAAVVSSATTSNQVVLGNQYVTDLRCNVTTISAISDARDKKDVVDLPIGLEFVNSLRPVKFEWDRRDGSMAGLKEAGFIAQELDAAQGAAGAEEYLRLVLKDNPDRLEASPGKLIPVLVKAIQELKAEVDALKNA